MRCLSAQATVCADSTEQYTRYVSVDTLQPVTLSAKKFA